MSSFGMSKKSSSRSESNETKKERVVRYANNNCSRRSKVIGVIHK